jgi:hypothetical protein
MSPNISFLQKASDDDENDHEVKKAFVHFIAKFGKVYASHEDSTARFQIFKENFKKIQ